MSEKIESKQVYDFLEGMKVNGKFEFIEDASQNTKLQEIIDKANLKAGNRDLGFFHNIYAIVDKANKNKCILPKDKVEAGLTSIRQKPVNAEHNRTSVLGHYLDAEIIDNEIHSYGCIYKSCFPDKWDEAKKLFQSGKLNSSFEIWCPKEKRTYKDNGDFTLDEIEIAGGAILFKEPPAFDEAKVLELAKEVATNNNSMVYAYDESDMIKCDLETETSKLFVEDMPWVRRLIDEIECPVCAQKYWFDMVNLDFENLMVDLVCSWCGSKVKADLMPKTKVTKQGKIKKVTVVERASDIPSEGQMLILEETESELINKLQNLEKSSYDCECLKCGYTTSSEEHCKDIKCPKCGGEMRREDRPSKSSELDDSDFALIQHIISKKTKVKQKVRRFPIDSKENVKASFEELFKTKDLNESEAEIVKNKILKKAKLLNMNDIVDKYNKNKGGINMEELKKAQEKIELLEENLKAKDDIIASKDEELNALKAKVTETEEAKKAVETERDNIKAEIARRDEEIKQSTIKARKEELGEEYIKANSVKDEDLLDNVKFENAKLKKENAELKKNPENAMIAGSRQPKSKDEIQKAHDKVEAEAYGYEGSEEK